MARLECLAIAASILTTALAAPACAQQNPGARLKAAAEACVRTAASDVERAEPSLLNGATFITTDLCANEISAQQRFEDNTKSLEQMRREADDPNSRRLALSLAPKDQQDKLREEVKAAYAKAYVDPTSGELVMPQPLPSTFSTVDTTMNRLFSQAGLTDTTFRALAARALLDARLARLRAEGSR